MIELTFNYSPSLKSMNFIGQVHKAHNWFHIIIASIPWCRYEVIESNGYLYYYTLYRHLIFTRQKNMVTDIILNKSCIICRIKKGLSFDHNIILDSKRDKKLRLAYAGRNFSTKLFCDKLDIFFILANGFEYYSYRL